jgi:acyl-CoA hydrolase
MRNEKTINDSKTISKYMVMPQHANPMGVMFGGILMGWIDLAAAMVAEKHSGHDVAIDGNMKTI